MLIRGARIIHGLRFSPEAVSATAVTIGVFDGVHCAHQRLIRRTAALARSHKLASIVVTFDPDPQEFFHPDQAPLALMPLKERLSILSSLGVDYIWVIPFTRSFAHLSARAFVRKLLIKQLHAKYLVIGDAFAFGNNRIGDLSLLRQMGQSHGMRIIAVSSIKHGGVSVSSSRIRRLISEGKLAEARHLLTRPPALYGVIVRGSGRGRRLGVPTANIQSLGQVLPPQGVYAVTLCRSASGRLWRGVMNLGRRPTFGGGSIVCEVHLFGFSGNLLGDSVAVSLIRRLRGERRFPSPKALYRQVHKDILRARRILA